MLVEITRMVTLINEKGLHARAAAAFVKCANNFKSEIYVSKDDNKVSGKSIIGLMLLAALMDETLVITTKGDDAYDAMDAITFLISNRFGEEK